MTSFLESMAWPFLACLILTGIHVYLGIHVIARKVIFVDLALAQIAALGAVWGVLLGWDVHDDPWPIKGFSLTFTFAGAAVFSLTRMRHERVPHEAIIGIAYAVALAATILASAHLAHGAEEVRDLLAGSILWVDAGTVGWTAALYAAIGAFHFAFRRRFLTISLHPERAEAEGLRVRLWDFLFYVSFGFVVTSSVAIAGVLLVFSYLVIPAVIGVLFAERTGARLAIGWSVGTLVSLAGVLFSYARDLPSGPTIVVMFGAFLAAAGVLHYLRVARELGPALIRVGGVAAALGLAFAGTFLFQKSEEHDLLHLLETGVKGEKLSVLLHVEAEPELWSAIRPAVPQLLQSGPAEVRLKLLQLVAQREDTGLLDELHALLSDPDDLLREKALEAIRRFHRPESIGPILAAVAAEPDEHLRVELAEALLELGDVRGIPPLLDVMERGEAQLARRDAYEHLGAHLALELPYDAAAGSDERERAVAPFRRWWEEHRDRLTMRGGAVIVRQ